ncbi:MAG: YafY family protein [Herpetosiphon sp.]
MNRTDRLLAIVLELQGKGKLRATDLAATFEISIRTVYRDMEALCAAGVPVVSVPGRGYELVEGYFLPPLRFSADEAMMLLLGCDVMTQHFDAEYRAAAQSASRKIAAVLAGPLRTTVRELAESFRFVVGTGPGAPAETERLQLLRRAMIQRRVVQFQYHGRQGSRSSLPVAVRVVDPYALVHASGVWYVSAFCHTRQAMRNFRIDRIEQPTLLDETFTRTADFRLEAPDTEQRRVVVRVLFDDAVARSVREAQSFFMVHEEETLDGFLVTLNVRQEQDVLQWLLGWGRHVRIVEPASLREQLAAEARAILQHVESQKTLLT